MGARPTQDRLQDILRGVFHDQSLLVTRKTVTEDIDGWDSFNHVRVILQVEREFGLKFTVAEMLSLKDVGALVDLIDRKKKV